MGEIGLLELSAQGSGSIYRESAVTGNPSVSTPGHSGSTSSVLMLLWSYSGDLYTLPS